MQDAVAVATSGFLAVELNVSFIGTSVKDKVITAEIAEDKNMAKGEGRYTKSIFKDALDEFVSLRTKASRYVNSMTFEGIGSQRLLAVKELPEFHAKLEEYRHKLQAEVDKFIEDYDTHVQNDRFKKGLAFRATDYPPKATLANRFKFDLAISPVADPSQFNNASLDAATCAVLVAKHKSQLIAAVDKSRDEIIKTMLGLISEVATVLANPDAVLYDAEGKKGPVPKLAEYLERVPALNVTGDQTINALVAQCKNTLVLATNTLKASSTIRSKTSVEASAILQQFQSGGGMGRKLSA